MTYIRTSSNPGKKRAQTLTLICAVFIVAAIGIQYSVPHFIPSIFTTIAQPFWRMEFSLASGSLDSPQSLLAQNEDLKRQIVALNVEQGSIQSVVSQNEDLLAMLGRSAAVGSSTASSSKVNGAHILGAVLVRPPMAAYDEIIIDAGSDDGIMAGARVYAPGNVLIGTTTDVLSQTSKVTLFSSPGQQYPVLIGSSHIPATSVGRGGGQYEADVPQASKIDQGDIVSDSSLSDSAFGIVTTVLANPADPFETVLFAPPVNIYQLRWVLVEAPAKKN